MGGPGGPPGQPDPDNKKEGDNWSNSSHTGSRA